MEQGDRIIHNRKVYVGRPLLKYCYLILVGYISISFSLIVVKYIAMTS